MQAELAGWTALPAVPRGHYLVWRCLTWGVHDGEETGKARVCGVCVPKHSAFPARDAVPEWPLHRITS